MAQNSFITFSGKEMYRLLVRNPYNRAVSREDFKNNDYFSVSSVKKAESRVKKLIRSIRADGWQNNVVYAFKNDKGYYVLLDGNNRRKALDLCVEEGILPDYPEWDVIDLSVRTNPETGKPYTFDEAQKKVEHSNIHAQEKHTATDIIEAHAGSGNILCRDICDLAKKYNAATNLVSDLVTCIRGSSKEENVERIIAMERNEERLRDVDAVLEMIYVMDSNRTEDRKIMKACHSVYAFENVYELCKMCGVEKEFCEMMKAVSLVRRPNPFINFFDDDKVTTYTNKILYLIDGFFDGKKIHNITDNMYKIREAFEKHGVSSAIAKFHRDNALGKKGVRLEIPKKVA